QLAEELERPLDVRGLRRLVLVDDRLDQAGGERPAARQLEQAEALTALDDDVHPAVLEHLEHVDDRRPGANFVHRSVARGEDEPELAARLEALADQLLVARLEDVQGQPLRRHEHERERKEAELLHRLSLSPVGSRTWPVPSSARASK